MTPSRGLRCGLLALALASIVPVAEAEMNYVPLAVAAVCAAVGELLRSARRPWRVPVFIIALLSVACAAYLVVEMFFVTPPVPAVLALGHFLVFLACCKFLEPMQTRDMGVVLVISLLLMVIGGLTSGSVTYAAVLGFQLTFGMYWLIRFHQQREQAAVRAAGAVATPQPPARLPRLRIAGAAFVISAMLVMTAMASFVLMPRGLSRQLFGRLRSPIAAAVTGYTDQIELESGGLRESDAPVMRVRLSRGGVPLDRFDGPLYLRGRTFDCYTRGRWLSRTFAAVWRLGPSSLDEPQVLSSAYRTLPANLLITQNIWLEAGKGPPLFCLLPPLAVSAGEGNAIEQNCDDYSLAIRNYRRQAIHYVVVSAAEVSRRTQQTLDMEYGIRSEEFGRWRFDDPRRTAPPDSPLARTSSPQSEIPQAVVELARQVTASDADAPEPLRRRAMAARIEAFLRSDRFEYTLDPVTYGPGDRLVQFLTDTRRGHCEMFASAMTAMCQSLGIPARLVSGYCGGDYNPVGSFYLVRQKDAHAWVEVFLPESGWTIFDPSPAASSRSEGAGADVWAALARFAEYLQFEWVTFVVSFDAEYRRRIFSRFEDWFRRIDESRSGLAYAWDVFMTVVQGPPYLTSRQRVIYWAVLALALVMVVLIVRLFWKLALIVREFIPRRDDGRAGPRRADARFYDRMLLLVARRGHRKPPASTPHEFALQVAAAEPELTDFVSFTDWYYEAQYGNRPLDGRRRAAVRRFLDFLREGTPPRLRGVTEVRDNSPGSEAGHRLPGGPNTDGKIRRDSAL